MIREEDFFDRILPRLVITETCWLWQGSKRGGNCRSDGAQYGQVRIRGNLHYVHRVVYTLFFGPIPEGYVIDHTCADVRSDGQCNPHCANPSHLKAVPAQTNNRRAAGKTNLGDRYAYEDEDEYAL